jgi:hypothetical protein
LKGSLLHFKVTIRTWNGINLLDTEAVETYRTAYKLSVPSGANKAEYDMQIVRWGPRIYLLEPDKIALFVAAVNFEVEPRPQIVDRRHLTDRFFLRTGDESKDATGKPELPEPWRSYLQDSSIRAVITKAESKIAQRIYTVNKGRADGVRVGMFFAGENKRPDYDDLLAVTAVEERSATLTSKARFRMPNHQQGDTLITKTVTKPR